MLLETRKCPLKTAILRPSCTQELVIKEKHKKLEAVHLPQTSRQDNGTPWKHDSCGRILAESPTSQPAHQLGIRNRSQNDEKARTRNHVGTSLYPVFDSDLRAGQCDLRLNQHTANWCASSSGKGRCFEPFR